MDQVSEDLVGVQGGDQTVVDAALEKAMAKSRADRGQTMAGGRKPTERTKKNNKATAGTAPTAIAREVAFSKSDAREVAGKSVLSSTSYEVGLGALLYYVVPEGGHTRPTSSLADGLAERVSAANGGHQVSSTNHRRGCCRAAAIASPSQP